MAHITPVVFIGLRKAQIFTLLAASLQRFFVAVCYSNVYVSKVLTTYSRASLQYTITKQKQPCFARI